MARGEDSVRRSSCSPVISVIFSMSHDLPDIQHLPIRFDIKYSNNGQALRVSSHMKYHFKTQSGCPVLEADTVCIFMFLVALLCHERHKIARKFMIHTL